LDHPYAHIEDGNLYRSAYLSFPALLLEPIEEGTEPNIPYFEKSYAALAKKVSDLEAHIDASDNKGSFLAKLKHIKSTLHEHRGIGDYAGLYQSLSQREEALEALIAENRQKNLEIKRALVEDARALQDSVDWRNTAEKLKTLRQNWIKTGSVPDEFTEELEEAFKQALDHFFERRNAFLDEKNAMIRAAEEKYRALISEAELLKTMSLSDAKNKVKELIYAWKALPKVPGPVQKNLWRDFSRHTLPYKKKTVPTTGEERSQRTFPPRKFARSKATDIPEVLREKERLFSQLEKLEDDWSGDKENTFKNLMELFKQAGASMGEKGKQVHYQFNYLAAQIRERLFLENLVRNRHEDFDQASEEKQQQLLVEALKELIHRDEQEYEEFLQNLGKFNIQTDDADKMMQRKKQSLENRIAAKKALLQKITH
jgi:hypothetical protein